MEEEFYGLNNKRIFRKAVLDGNWAFLGKLLSDILDEEIEVEDIEIPEDEFADVQTANIYAIKENGEKILINLNVNF